MIGSCGTKVEADDIRIRFIRIRDPVFEYVFIFATPLIRGAPTFIKYKWFDLSILLTELILLQVYLLK